MFDRFKSKADKSEDSSLTSLGLRSDAPPSVAKPGAAPNPPGEQAKPTPPAVNCPRLILSAEDALNYHKEIRKRHDAFVQGGSKPDFIFYLVFPQQGHSYSVSTADGTKTILLLFSSTIMANAYIEARNLKAVAAACRFESIPQQAEKWLVSGINFYALNPCVKCSNAGIFPSSDLQSSEVFREAWGLDAVNRRYYGEILLRLWNQSVSANPAASRKTLEGFRDHIDPCTPYLYLMLAALAGMAGDRPAVAEAIKRLDRFGPPFTGKLKEDSIVPGQVETWSGTVSEAWIGLLASYGILNVPMKPAGG